MAGSEASQPSPSPADCHGRTGSLLPCLHEVDAWLVSALFYANLSSTGPALPYNGKDHSFCFGRTGWPRQPSCLTCPKTSAAVYSPIPQRLAGVGGGMDGRTDRQMDRTWNQSCSSPETPGGRCSWNSMDIGHCGLRDTHFCWHLS